MNTQEQIIFNTANRLLAGTKTAAICIELADGKSAYLGDDAGVMLMLQNKDQSGAAASGKVDLQARLPASGPLTEVVTTIFRRARTSDTEACTFSASSVATPVAAVRGEAVAEIAPADLMARFEKWKAYPLPALNSDGHFDKDWLHREFVAFKAGVVSARAADAPYEPSELAKRLRGHASLFKVGCEPYIDTMAAADALDSQPGMDDPTERESLIACLGDDAVTLLRVNPDDEMAQTMREAAAMLEADGKALDSQPTESEGLPPLPEPIEVGGEGWDFDDFKSEKTFSCEHMWAYARAAIASSQPTDGGVRK